MQTNTGHVPCVKAVFHLRLVREDQHYVLKEGQLFQHGRSKQLDEVVSHHQIWSVCLVKHFHEVTVGTQPSDHSCWHNAEKILKLQSVSIQP